MDPKCLSSVAAKSAATVSCLQADQNFGDADIPLENVQDAPDYHSDDSRNFSNQGSDEEGVDLQEGAER